MNGRPEDATSLAYLTWLPLIRCEEEDVKITEDAIRVLTAMAGSTTLRYAFQLISCANLLARRRKATEVDSGDVRRCYAYFLDEKRSTQWLKQQQGNLMFDETEADVQEDDAMQI